METALKTPPRKGGRRRWLWLFLALTTVWLLRSSVQYSTSEFLPSVPATYDAVIFNKTETRNETLVHDASNQSSPLPTSTTTTTPAPTSTLAPTTWEDSVRNLSYWDKSWAMKQVAAASLHAPPSQERPDDPLQLWRLVLPTVNVSLETNATTNTTEHATPERPMMAIITSTLSKDKTQVPVEESLLVKHLLSSILTTVTPEERQLWRVHLYVAVDDTDTWWQEHWSRITLSHLVQDWFNVTFAVFPTRPSNIPFNEIALVAYQEGAEYLCRVNDDTEFTSTGWISTAVAALRAHTPPNVGVVAPTCGQGNTVIMTHDFVHRTHLDIFYPHYYPPVFDNYYLDDWMTHVYSSHVVGPDLHWARVLPEWHVKHWVVASRYSAKGMAVQWLPYEYETSRRLLVAYLSMHAPTQAALVPSTVPARPVHTSDTVVAAVQDVLATTNGNLLVWGLDTDAPYWHTSTTGHVFFLNEETWDLFRDTFYKPHQYVAYDKVVYQTQHRGNVHAAYHDYVVGHSLSYHPTWCSLEMTLNPHLHQTTWDVILVQTPQVCTSLNDCDDASGPGPFQPLYMTHVLVTRQLARMAPHRTIHVWIKDYERPHVQEFATVLLDTLPHQVHVNGTAHVAHFTLHANSSLALYEVDVCPPPMVFPKLSDGFVPQRYASPTAVAASSVHVHPESWVILLHVNRGYHDLWTNWWYHFGRLNLSIPVLVMTLDDTVHDIITKQVQSLKYNVTVQRCVETSNTTAFDWGSLGFHQIVAQRPRYIRQQLEQRRNVIYTDVDTVWRSSPLPYLADAGTSADLVAAVNLMEHGGYSPYYVTGFMAIVANNRTIDLMNRWDAKHQDPSTAGPNGPTLNAVLHAAGNTVTHQPLSWREFPNGQIYFDAKFSAAQRKQVVVVHNDYIAGVRPKQDRFMAHGLWNVT